jgi:outer membrane protein assembly factor BamB
MGTLDGIWAFDATDGTTLWQREPLDPTYGHTVHEDTVYYSTDSAHYAVSVEDGSEQWRYETPGGVMPALLDGTVFTSTRTEDNAGQVLALDAADGTERWTTRRPVNTVTAADGTVYVSAGTEHDDDRYADGAVFALDATTGEEEWAVQFDFTTLPSIAVADGTAYVGENVHLYALDTADGSERWRFDMQQYGRDPSPATVAGDTVCFTNGRGRLFALDTESGTERWTVNAPGEPGGDIVVTEGMLLAGGANGLRAFSHQ